MYKVSCTKVRAIFTGRSTVSGCDSLHGLAVFRALLCLHGAILNVLSYILLFTFSELSLVGLALDVVDYQSSFSAMTLLVGSSDQFLETIFKLT